MMGPGEVFLALIIIGLPVLALTFVFSRWFSLKERKLEIEAINAAEKAAQYVARSSEIEQRLAVIERIVTDGGVQTAAQIEALRAPRLTKEENV